mgnify:CR=1 FL=1|tara:strand:+ start:4838 stop:5899 length:1062 start_codon:yes stop_codon:yes gene_type:complete
MPGGVFEPTQVGKREDLADFISVIDARGTPVLSMLPTGKPITNTYFEWLLETEFLPSDSTYVGGTDHKDYLNADESRARIGSYVQYTRNGIRVADDAEDISTVAGVKSEYARAMKKAMVKSARDIEATILSSQEHQAGSATAKYYGRGLGTWILDTTNIAGQSYNTSTTQVPEEFRPASGNIITTAVANIEDSTIQDLLQSTFDQVGPAQSNYVLVCGSELRRRFTDLTRSEQYASTNTPLKQTTHNYDGASDRFRQTVTFFEGDFGMIEVLTSSFIGWSLDGTKLIGTQAGTPNTSRGYVLDPSQIELRWQERLSHRSQSDEGGGPRGFVRGRWGLCVKNPLTMSQFNTALS